MLCYITSGRTWRKMQMWYREENKNCWRSWSLPSEYLNRKLRVHTECLKNGSDFWQPVRTRTHNVHASEEQVPVDGWHLSQQRVLLRRNSGGFQVCRHSGGMSLLLQRLGRCNLGCAGMCESTFNSNRPPSWSGTFPYLSNCFKASLFITHFCSTGCV